MAKKILAPPDQPEREYTRLLTRLVRELRSDINEVLLPAARLAETQFSEAVRTDAWMDVLTAAMLRLAELATGKVNRVLLALPGQYNIINRLNERQFRMVVRANTGIDFGPLGVNPLRGEPFLRPLFEGWIAENTSLVKSIPEQYHNQLEGSLRRGIMSGQSVRDLAKDISGRFDVTMNRAKLIATDQTLSAYSDLTEYRLKSVGVKEYTWRTVQDSRVRPEHAEREGKVFSWDKPPSDGHPGQPVRCRCSAEAVWPEEYEDD